MTRKALRIASENGKVYYRTFPIGKKKENKYLKLQRQQKQINPMEYNKSQYGAKYV